LRLLLDLPADRIVDSRFMSFVDIDTCQVCRRRLEEEDVRTPVFVDGIRKIACAECGGKYCENCRSDLASMHLENNLFSQPFLVCAACANFFLKKGTSWRLASLWSSVNGAFYS